jgi:uncharacterized protein
LNQQQELVEQSAKSPSKFSFRKLFHREPNRFINLLTQQARLTEEGLQALVAYFEKPNKKRADAVNTAEEAADEIRRILIDELNRTFVTPIDREDIHSLSRAIDDMLDYANTTVSEMTILEVEPTESMRQIGALLSKSASDLRMGVEQLGIHSGVVQNHVVRVKRAENQVEELYCHALKELFTLDVNNPAEIVKMLKVRETYRHLSNAADRGDEAANILSDIVVKSG